MGVEDPHVLAVTTNASLVIGLTFTPRNWEVTSEAAAHPGLSADVVVLDVGGTVAGLAAAATLPVGTAAVIIGDDEPDVPLPVGVDVVVRPYTLDDLVWRIDALLTRADSAPAPAARSFTARQVWDAAAPVDATAAVASHSVRAPEQPAPTVIDLDDDVVTVGVVAGSRRPLSARMFGRLAGRRGGGPPAEPGERPAPVPLSSPEDELPDPPGSTELPDQPVPAGDATASQVSDERPPDDGACLELVIDVTDGVGVQELPEAAEPEAMDATIPAAQPVAAEPHDGHPAVRHVRWHAARGREVTEPERELQGRLAQVIAATSELERLVEEVPLLSDLDGLGRAIVRETRSQLDADTVGLWRAAPGGWRVVAHHGLTKHEATWLVPSDHPLFAEVHATGGALLIDPVDQVHAAVAGIGGAHTESFMAAAIAVGPGRYGIVAVGRDVSLTEQDLDTLCALTLEMAPGMAVAEQLDRLRIERPTAPEDEPGATD